MSTERVPVTREGLEKFKAELEELTLVKRPALAEAVAEARSHGDLRENSAYDAARHDQMMNERRIAELDALLRRAEIVDEGKDLPTDRVELGSTVVVDFEGEEERYMIVGAIEAKPSEGKISNESPLGRALIGKRPGARVEVGSPAGPHEVVIVRIERG